MGTACVQCETEFDASVAAGASVQCPACGTPQRATATGVPVARRPVSAAPTPATRSVQRSCRECRAKFPIEAAQCPSCGAEYRASRPPPDDSFESRAADKGALAGVGMVVLAVVWFVVGYSYGRIFFYPPVLAVVGVAAIVGSRAKARAARARTEREERRTRERTVDDPPSRARSANRR
jgi:ribosomal protein L40E